MIDVAKGVLDTYGLGALGYVLALVFVWRNFKLADYHRKAMEKMNAEHVAVVVANTNAITTLTESFKNTQRLLGTMLARNPQ